LRLKSLPAEDETVKELVKGRATVRDLRRRQGEERRETERKMEPFKSSSRKEVRAGVQLIRRAFFAPKMNGEIHDYRIPPKVILAQETNCGNILFEEYPSLLREETGDKLTLTKENYKVCYRTM
jgi:hypothetical protein